MEKKISFNHNINNDQKIIKKDILLVLISIYYYENNVNKVNSFNENEKYFLIKPNWIISFKEKYNYQELSNILNLCYVKEGENNIPVNYNNFENFIDNIKSLLNENEFIVGSKEIDIDLFDEKNLINHNFYDKDKKFYYCQNCYIINLKILEKIQKYIFGDKKLNIKKKEIINKDNNVFIIFSTGVSIFITVGNLNEQLIFISKYVLCYNIHQIYIQEKKILFGNSIEYYIKKCQERHTDLLILKNEKNENIAKFMVLESINRYQTDNKNHNLKKITYNLFCLSKY